MSDSFCSTVVTFPEGAIEASSTIVHIQRVLGLDPKATHWAVFTEATPFHPVDPTWPDQPGDTGVLLTDVGELPVTGCVTAAVARAGGELLVDAEITAKRGDPEYAWLVCHLVADRAGDLPGRLVGTAAKLLVDRRRRRRLSVAHTACHLTGLALNVNLADRWRKPIRTDGLGRPDFDGVAIVSSRIAEDGAMDTYRLGTSLRKAGFVSEGFADGVSALQSAIETSVAEWVRQAGQITVLTKGSALHDRRTWECVLQEGTARTSCGGTHPQNTGELGSVTVRCAFDPDTKLLTVATTVVPS
ncbi:putative metal-dependent hydrolase [Catenulispora acidiphila DSM 44928]|uniref:Putative metal-dependent hydrolase n=1 Tax=Catenulispora acidiphila (strain DSM 44928 / JCM 14897 / NBRC 102108 / NRRL B-24433 / ID139908) TaxID=479433 RepID=C7QJ43_CATAD|nr:metal-dependent hydrolase [Catenulispora acidiphila]ACU69185.1 putative metal-dependent hydrolase [Catenulispora acidiphila DSM 44928]